LNSKHESECFIVFFGGAFPEETREQVTMKKITQEQLDQLVDRIVLAVHPREIYLYGSHVYGEPHENSDVDLVVVLPETEEENSVYQRAVETYAALRGLMIPAEIKVETCREFEERSHWPSTVEHTVKEKGKRLYGSPD
jgi:predicted nucleotidyltransferase